VLRIGRPFSGRRRREAREPRRGIGRGVAWEHRRRSERGAVTKIRHSGFTLTEVLIAVAIVGLLVALLAPAGSSAWEAALATCCRQNLRTIYAAEGSWRADQGTAVYTSGPMWQTALLGYVEEDEEVFTCPSATGRWGRASTCVGWPALEWDIYSGGVFRCRANLTTGSYCRKTQIGPNCWEVRIEDWAWSASCDWDWNDLNFRIWFEDGVAQKMEIMPGQTGFYYDMYLNGELALQDWGQHYGEEFDLPGTTGLSGVLANYGLSKGTYEVAAGEVRGVDPRQFLVLDYPRLVADYNGDGMEDDWDRYFFEDSEAWLARHGAFGTEDWRQHQALRHGGTANVLFCDGHVEALGMEELAEQDSRWRMGE